VTSPPRAVVLVEGLSDQAAVEALAARRGRDLESESVTVVPIGGAQAMKRFLDRYGPHGLDVTLAGLYDAGEEDDVRRALARAGLEPGPTRGDLEALGFYACEADLEDELIRALGTDAVERVVEEQGDLYSLRILQQQPAQRGRTVEAQLRRFMGTRSGRKIAYARLLVEALPPDRVPAPLDGVLARVERSESSRTPSG
jgi:predicted ATP-dependent endonuclease of OLD family